MLIGRAGGVVGVRLSVANTDRGLLEWIHAASGVGNVYQQHTESQTHRASYSWRSHGDGAVGLLRQMLTFLRVKASQAKLAIECHERFDTPHLKADHVWQHEWMARMKAMNRRGPASASA